MDANDAHDAGSCDTVGASGNAVSVMVLGLAAHPAYSESDRRTGGIAEAPGVGGGLKFANRGPISGDFRRFFVEIADKKLLPFPVFSSDSNSSSSNLLETTKLAKSLDEKKFTLIFPMLGRF